MKLIVTFTDPDQGATTVTLDMGDSCFAPEALTVYGQRLVDTALYAIGEGRRSSPSFS